uniref:Ig-like domain-containing protein n=1 Tax=Lates calcarifer TaxID=8187 RepID=A0A4W6G3K6_LATCA
MFSTEVSCVFMESCILPCSFQSGADPIIHWIQVTAGNLYVHSFYNNQDQLRLQNQHFRNRTSLFKDQISRGNASLQLTGVEVQDQGGYRCYTRTMRGNKDSFINLRVDGMRDTQEIHKDICFFVMCSSFITVQYSEGIYPEPDLTWSTSPLSNLTLQNQTSIQQTEQQLYNISSSLILSDSETDLIYICTIRRIQMLHQHHERKGGVIHQPESGRYERHTGNTQRHLSVFVMYRSVVNVQCKHGVKFITKFLFSCSSSQ